MGIEWVEDEPNILFNITTGAMASYTHDPPKEPELITTYTRYRYAHVVTGNRATQLWESLCAAALRLPTDEEQAK